MNTRKPDRQSPVEDDTTLARLLQAAGRRQQLPDELQQRWEAHFRQRLQQARRRRRQRRGALALVASLVLVVAGVLWLPMPARDGAEALLQVTRVAGRALLAGDDEFLVLQQADTLALPVRLRTEEGGWLALRYRGYDLRLDQDSRVLVDRQGVTLEAGAMYASTAHGSRDTLRLMTPFGELRDVGTQFSARLEADRLVALVRRGAIELHREGRRVLVEAPEGGARQMLVDHGGEVALAEIPPGGADWGWIHRASPGFVLEGRSAYEFLTWVSRETGLTLRFSNAASATRARLVRLHGDIVGLPPLQALEPVLAGTDLRVRRLDQRVLEVRLARSE